MLKIEFSGSTPAELAALVKDYVKQLKGTRGGKNDDGDGDGAQTGSTTTGNAPAPLQPPQGAAFPGNPGAGTAGAFPSNPGGTAGAFPSNPGPAFDPAVAGLVQRIGARIDQVTAPPPAGMGQDVNQTLNWFRGQCGPEAANATLDQIKTVFLPKLSVPSLENIAKLIGVG